MNVIRQTAFFIAALSVIVCYTAGFRLNAPKALKVDCKSLGNNTEFKHRVKQREGAEDNITILLFKNEELAIHFHMTEPSVFEVLDVRYSNDGGLDIVQVSLDDKRIGQFKTPVDYKWGIRWNHFESSGPVGGPCYIEGGLHKLTLTILDSDFYGMEIDYIRFNVHGSKIDHLDEEFMCVHKPFLRKGTEFKND